MNTQYLDTLPAIDNVHNMSLMQGEKVVFTATFMFGTDADKLLGSNAKFTLTNKKIIMDNGAGIWTDDIAGNVVSCQKIEPKRRFFKMMYFLIMLKNGCFYDNDKQHCNGYRFYIKGKKANEFEQIMSRLTNECMANGGH